MELNKDVQKAIISQLLGEVEVQIFKFTSAHKANARVGAPQEQLDAIKNDLVRLEGLKAAYEEQLKELE